MLFGYTSTSFIDLTSFHAERLAKNGWELFLKSLKGIKAVGVTSLDGISKTMK
jgi:hypothetical protein